MSNEKQKQDQAAEQQPVQRARGARTPSVDPAFNGELPHSTKKVSLGPNTKR